MKKRKNKYSLIALIPLLFSSGFLLAAQPEQPKEQPIKQVTTQVPHGKLIWADLYTGDVKASLDFYTKTFGWTVKKLGEKNNSYHLLFDGETAIAGVLARSAQRNETEIALWVGSISTDNVQTRVTSAANNNAEIILKPHDFVLYGKRAVIADPQGGVIALLDINSADNTQQKISDKWDWAQLFSTDTKKAASFYHKTFDYTVEEVTEKPGSYYLSQQGKINASIVKLPTTFEQRDRWISFVEVNNLTETLTNAIKNGAKIIHQPKDGHLAIIADPNGALLGLTEQESE